MKKKTNQLKAGVIFSYLQMGINILIGILYTPVMLRLLGQNEYGLYNTVSSTISMISILSLGLNSGYIRYFAKYKKDNDMTSIYKLNGLFLLIFSIIGLIALACGIFLTGNLTLIFDEGLTSSEYEIAKVLMILLTVNLAISFPMGVFSHIISANERFIFLKIMGMMKTVLGPLVTLPLLLMGYRSIAMVSVTLLIAIITDIVYCFYVFKVLKYKFIFHDFEKGIFKSLFAYTGFIALNLIVNELNSSVDKVIISRYLGTAATAIYSIGHSLYVYFTSFSTAISGVFTPRIHKIVNETLTDEKEQRKKLTDLFTRVGRIQFLVLGLFVTGIIFFGEFFINLWAGEGYKESYYVTLLLCIPSIVPLIQNVGISIQRAQNKHQFRSIIYFVMALLNVIASIILTPKIGVLGATIGTAISLVLCNGIIINIFYHKKCNIDILAFWKKILKILPSFIIPVIFGMLWTFVFGIDSIVKFIIGIGTYSVVYCISVWFIGANSEEKKMIITSIRRLLKK